MTTFNSFQEAREFAYNTHQQVFQIRGVLCVLSPQEAENAMRYGGLEYPDYIARLTDEENNNKNRNTPLSILRGVCGVRG